MSALTVSIMWISGRWLDPWLWAYAVVAFVSTFPGIYWLDEDLARERFSPPVPGADRLALRAIRILAVGHLIVSALDLRFQLAPAVPSVLRGLALAGMAAGFLMVFRAMRENHFFSAVIRVQSERGHHVVMTGPYAAIRHPGYAGMIVAVPLSGLALGSWIGAAVALVYSAFILRRVGFEDGFLQRSLDGYREYVTRVRYRLVPGLW